MTDKRVATHAIVPTPRRLDATQGMEGKVVYVGKCTGCPWHAANPVTFRAMIAEADLGFKINDVVKVEHATKHGHWGDWRIVTKVTWKDGKPVVEGSTEIKHEGRNPGVWAIAPKPAEQPAAQ